MQFVRNSLIAMAVTAPGRVSAICVRSQAP